MSDDNRSYKNDNQSGQNQNGSGPGKGDNKKNANRIAMLISLLSALFMIFGFWWISSDMDSKSTEEITYDQFIDYLEEGKIERVEINADSSADEIAKTLEV